ncbi:hypothetical protein [Agrobacterium rosae]|uniref:Uncharacterized protein n=1 Tax=Agrobacterium rosae TaxID=1972867 RepID=A0A1R3U361_9HYPH|nr:hypothetical protein [Agrobacterium rosae]SCX36018.1 hypothetical protein DSM25559_5282 [Agrobacterium rosae]
MTMNSETGTAQTNVTAEEVAIVPLAERVDQLIGKRNAWQKAVMKTNTMHYGILQDIAILAAKTKEDELAPLVVKFEITKTSKTRKILILAKIVFGAKTREEGQKASANAKAIEKAIAAGNAPTNVANWIASIGGVEKARKWKEQDSAGADASNSGSTTPPGPTQAASAIAESVSSPIIAEQDEKPLDRAKEYLRTAHGPLTIGAEMFHDISLPVVGSGYCAVIFSPTADGNYHPVFATSHNDAVDAVLKQMGRTLAEPDNEANSATSVIIAKLNAEDDDTYLAALMDAAATA